MEEKAVTEAEDFRTSAFPCLSAQRGAQKNSAGAPMETWRKQRILIHSFLVS
jgi:hypothetical protein